MRRPVARRNLALLVVAAVSACGEAAAPIGSNAVKKDTNAGPEDDGGGVAVLPDAVKTDAAEADTVVDPVTTCVSNDDCPDGICALTAEGQICTDVCVSSCDDKGFACKAVVQTAGDVIFACVPLHVPLCFPCRADADCTTVPGAASTFEGSRCLSSGDAGSFCATPCDDDTRQCPSGYVCGEVEGAAGRLCRPVSGACACSTLAETLGRTTECATPSELGTCYGSRSCVAGQLSVCDAPPPTAESCDGKDNDCNGSTDDLKGDGAKCAVTNELGTCSGINVCSGTTTQCSAPEPTAEACDGKDNDCDGETDETFPDVDGDGLAFCVDPDADNDGKLNDADNCPEVSNPDQQNCDFANDGGNACDQDDDNDLSGDDQDCQPCDKAVAPGLEEVCDGKDNNCSGKIDEGFPDIDADGVANCVDDNDDGDAKDDSVDNCPSVPNSDQIDTDGDLQGDACDEDDDADNKPDFIDNCPLVPNSNQTEHDEDGLGDACDADDDADEVDDVDDNCPLVSNPGQQNADGAPDGGDACDDDDDDDTVLDGDDNCPVTANPDQADTDKNGVGDACVGDADDDNVLDDLDNCPTIANPSQTDTDNDTQGDACDLDDDGDG